MKYSNQEKGSELGPSSSSMTGLCLVDCLALPRRGEEAFGSEERREYCGLPSRERILLRTAETVCWLRRLTACAGLLSILSFCLVCDMSRGDRVGSM